MTNTTPHSLRKRHSVSSITATGWDEQRLADADTVARASYATQWSGDIEGSGCCALHIAYTGGDPADPASLIGVFRGYEQVQASVAGRTGSFVLAVDGEHRDATVCAQVEIVPDSGTGGLAGISGAGHYTSTGTGFTLELDHEPA